MPICRVRYRFDVSQSNLRARVGTLDAEALEDRDPDEWGDPGEVRFRHWISAVDRMGTDYTRQLNEGYFKPQGRLEPIGAVLWEIE